MFAAPHQGPCLDRSTRPSRPLGSELFYTFAQGPEIILLVQPIAQIRFTLRLLMRERQPIADLALASHMGCYLERPRNPVTSRVLPRFAGRRRLGWLQAADSPKCRADDGGRVVAIPPPRSLRPAAFARSSSRRTPRHCHSAMAAGMSPESRPRQLQRHEASARIFARPDVRRCDMNR